MKRLILPVLILSLFISTPTYALSESVLDFLSRNGIYYYNPDGFSAGCYPGIGSFDGIATAGLSSLQSAFVDQYHDIAAELSAEYGIPWETVMAQGLLESASGTSRYARERNNFFGLGAYDSDPDHAFSYSSAAAGWKGYFETIENNANYRLAGAFDYPSDPYGYLVAIKSAGYATDPNYITKVGSLIKAVENRATEKGWDSSATIAKTAGISSALSNLNSHFYSCSSVTQGNKNINATALALSWADNTHALTDPKSEYRTALSVVNLSNYGDEFVRIGASCDAFVATVLRFSGIDPNVKCCGAANMLSYFASHPELYEEIPNTGSSANLQPGDIRVKTSHVELYVVDENGTGKIASASHGDRTADHAINFYPDSSYRIFRYRGASV